MLTHHTMMAYEDWRYSSTILDLGTRRTVVRFLEKEPPVPIV
jgi:hypothetical protein